MEMGDDDGGGLGFGVLFDMGGLGLFGTIVVLGLMIGLLVYCSAERGDQRREFCTETCSQYNDAPVIQGSQCYCRDDKGIYDPATQGGVR